MVKSNKWNLIRLKQDRVFFLNVGKSTIGRNKEADVCTPSNICSRNHCFITLDAINDCVTLINQSTNGTYVNDALIETEPRSLKHGDIIGIGCTESIFEVEPKEKWSGYYIYKLVNNTLRENGSDNVINLISDDEEDVQPQIPNENQAAQRVENQVDNEDNEVNEVNDDNDDNDIIYSQQVMLEIKKEVNNTDEIDDDYSILIDSDDSDDGNESWSHRLSQNQDFVIKKVTEQQQNNKRKSVKEIEPIPLLAAKRCRKNSLPATAKQILCPVETMPRARNDLYDQPSTSDGRTRRNDDDNAKSIKENEKPKPFVDKFDPFVAKQKVDEAKKNFDEALKQVATSSTKKRIAHKPKIHPKNGQLVSILKKTVREEGKSGRRGRRVQFANGSPTIREYTPDRDDIGEIIASPVKSMQAHGMDSLSSFQNDPLHNIITDVTEWRTDWISQRNTTPPINGVNFVVAPLSLSYPNFESYKNTLTPLLKHELWSSIQAENRHQNRLEAVINAMSLAKRANRNRYVFHVQLVGEGSNATSNTGDFVCVETNNHPNFFAYVTNSRSTVSGYSKTTYLTLEASEAVSKLKHGESTTIYIKPIANIRTELKLFNAIFYLNQTPFKNLILNPKLYKPPTIPNNITKEFSYSGYDVLNKEQLHIMKSIYNKCMSKHPTLSLIEGPPGTGKTRVIVSIILQLLYGKDMTRKLRVLVLTSSNAAVDIIARRLLYIRDKMNDKIEKQRILNVVRFGVLNSMHPDVRRIAPQNLVATPTSPRNPEMKKLHADKKKLLEDNDSLRKSQHIADKEKIKDNEKRIKSIDAALEKMGNSSIFEYDNIRDVMTNARVVCSTLSSCINLKQYIAKFDVCFIDEASQCTEPWTLVPLQYAVSSFILIGDSNQLNPVVLSNVCRSNSLDRSLFARLYDTFGSSSSRSLITYTMTTQYRMHPEICKFPNTFYKNRLISAGNTKEPFDLQPYSVFSLNYLQSNSDMINYYNSEEATFIIDMLKVMVKHADPKKYTYGIITPYAQQRSEIQRKMGTSQTLAGFNIQVNTIDSYQGQERDIIILCTTRTTGIGFLANLQRLNVALTRAKKCLVICGNFTSISHTNVWKHLLADAKDRHKFHNIPSKYDFQQIADLLVKK
ncbi:uncharacterized ATP-dependent helicase C29A10.10c-like isoform X2 [Contarinia nasturtii]|nr:uncharacterized ATP-dependent helicase C29A10.10c-like isoform X2 [Contarinia nasturtii]